MGAPKVQSSMSRTLQLLVVAWGPRDHGRCEGVSPTVVWGNCCPGLGC